MILAEVCDARGPRVSVVAVFHVILLCWCHVPSSAGWRVRQDSQEGSSQAVETIQRRQRNASWGRLRRASLSGSDLEEVGEREKIRLCFGVGHRTDEEIFVHMKGKVLTILGTRCPEFSQHCCGRAVGAGFFGETKEFFIRQEFDRAGVK